jgi:rubrerythrin
LNRIVTKTVRLNLLPATQKKQEAIDELFSRYQEALAFIVNGRSEKSNRGQQEDSYSKVREMGIPSMLSCYLFSDATPILHNEGTVGRVSIPYNIPRSGNIAESKRGNPMVAVRTLKKRIAIPIAMDGAFQRYKQMLADGWERSAFRLGHGRIFVTMKHHYNARISRNDYDTVLGVDVGCRSLAAVSVLDKTGKIVKQLYLGRDLGNKQRDIGIRRSKLTALAAIGARSAYKAKKRLRGYESRLTKTRSEQIAHEVERLAEKYDSFIAVENLKDLNHARGNRKGNRKSKRMPYGRFRVALWSVASQNGRLVTELTKPETRGTSHTCSRCGRRGIRTGAVFHCPDCGYVGNADRNASVEIARRAALQSPSWGQFSAREVSVMAPQFARGGSHG